MIGLYYLPLSTICHEMAISSEGASKALRRVEAVGFAVYDPDACHVWVYNAIVFQVGESLKEHDNRIQGVMNALHEYRSSRFCKPFYDMNRKRYPLPDASWISSYAEPLRSPSEDPSKPGAGAGAGAGAGEKRSVVVPSDDSFAASLKSNPAYSGLDIDREAGKCRTWCEANGKVFSRRRLVNWLNRCERPMGANGSAPAKRYSNDLWAGRKGGEVKI